jgi:hypothetical protein
MRRRSSVPVLVLAAGVTFAAAAPAYACRGSQFETSTVLPTLPTAANQEDIVAKVEIVELLPWRPGWSGASVVKTRVVEGLKGIETGQVLIVLSRGSSCDQRFSLHDIGRQGYVAGSTERNQDGETVFVGAWQERDVRTHELKRVR